MNRETRAAVYSAIDSERTYQNHLARNAVQDQRPMEQLALIRHLLRQIDEEWYFRPGQPSMDNVRKIAAVAVRMMEEHGAPHRE